MSETTIFGKPEIVDAVSQSLDAKYSKKEIGEITSTLFEVIKATVENGDAVRFIDFGTFGSAERKKRTGRNPQTGEEITIPAHGVPTFKPAKSFKDAVK